MHKKKGATEAAPPDRPPTGIRRLGRTKGRREVDRPYLTLIEESRAYAPA